MGWFEERGCLAGTVAVVTGGASGLGRAIVVDLAANGVRTAVLDIDPTAVDELRTELEHGGTEALVRHGDARGPDTLGRLFAAVDERWGRLDTLVNVVGGTWASAGWFNWPGEGWANHVPLRILRGGEQL